MQQPTQKTFQPGQATLGGQFGSQLCLAGCVRPGAFGGAPREPGTVAAEQRPQHHPRNGRLESARSQHSDSVLQRFHAFACAVVRASRQPHDFGGEQGVARHPFHDPGQWQVVLPQQTEQLRDHGGRARQQVGGQRVAGQQAVHGLQRRACLACLASRVGCGTWVPVQAQGPHQRVGAPHIERKPGGVRAREHAGGGHCRSFNRGSRRAA